MRAPMIAAVCAAAGLLVGCGSATVEQEAPSSITPLDPGSDAASDAPSSASAGSSSASMAAKNGASASSGSGEPAAQDEGTREISEVPSPTAPVDVDADYLAALGQSGINVEGVEDQLLGVGQNACGRADDVTIGAVAGQLIEQGRTQLPHEQVTALITNAANAAYCS